MDIKKDILIRTYLVYLVIICFGVAIAGKAVYTQQAQGKYWRSMADTAHNRTETIIAERGSIYADDGSVLSTSIPEFDIFVDFGADGLREKNGKLFKDNIDSLAWYMADLFKEEDGLSYKTEKTYKKEFLKAYNDEERYYLFKRKISFQQWEAMKKFPLIRLGKNKSGFIADVRMKRLNPFKLFANRTIGLARDSNKVGLEKAYDSSLAGENGERLVRYVSGGGAIPIDGSDVEATDGSDVYTTLDIAIQDIAEQALLKMMKGNDCERGTCIVMEVKTGKVKAIANLGRIKDRDSTWWEDYNYAISPTEPGSTFKLATLISVLEDGYVTINSPVNLEGGKWTVAGETVYDAEFHGLHETTVQHAFEHSSNVGMAKLAYVNYNNQPSKFLQHLHQLRFDTLTGIDLPGEVRPTIHKPGSKYWSNSTLPWMGFGYSLAVSPLQTLSLYNAVANGGVMMRPYLVTAIKKDGIIVSQHEPVIVNDKVCSKNTLAQLYTCLEGVVLSGTGKALKTDAYRFGGKTGTALVADKGITYKDKVYQSSFAGFFPLENPQYSCIVVIRNKAHAARFYGGSVAGPVFREVADKLFGMKVQPAIQQAAAMKKDSSLFQFTSATLTAKNVMRGMGLKWVDSSNGQTKTSLLATNKNYNVMMKSVVIASNAMPLIKGMTLRDAIALCEAAGLKTSVRGSGRVISQSIDPGTAIRKGQIVQLELLSGPVAGNTMESSRTASAGRDRKLSERERL
ncbi:MAG: penicillin-binding protein [Chitinophagaceae bacterium]